ncbi:signal recognition particle-docking protein FtsY [Tepidiforma thermophila]|uniref:Signal recognition particle receptor FtsY n=1 Tax=Tepidiforma thermophila (strain KCTC 52669 / CGMCC 1.13589 / G233) TaxID=2761530 RepID=A0A2A9HIG8_TEPT2|nr:signal recognition particle-docking protein FtsY [Tepidiforma thermophila]PFG74776.1 signal recognition particle-docking protein FtsY [Tepidiforma thermophila]
MRFWRRKPAEAQPANEAAPPAPAEPTAEERAELHEQTGRAVERTRRGIFGRLTALFEKADFGEAIWDELEEILIGSDAGLETTTAILDRVRQRARKEGVKQSARVREILRDELIATLREPGGTVPAWSRPDAPAPLVILVVGVNGAGKTTTIAKMAHAFKRDGATVILGAADTFRAAATDQLKVWGERVGVRVVAHQPGADPGAVAFDTLAAAESSRADVVIIDTAGRLHTKSNLMEELKKIDRVIKRKDPSAPHETLLVLDATTGQNGLQQARTFTGAVGVTGIVLAKLDGTAKGGIAFAIAHELGIPVRFIGTGERMEDLAPFDPVEFVDSLLA